MARIIHSRIKLFVEILFLVNKLLHYVEDKNTFKNFQFLETTITIRRIAIQFLPSSLFIFKKFAR